MVCYGVLQTLYSYKVGEVRERGGRIAVLFLSITFNDYEGGGRVCDSKIFYQLLLNDYEGGGGGGFLRGGCEIFNLLLLNGLCFQSECL